MTGADLRTILDRTAGTAPDRPDLDDLWARGRGRRRRGRVLAAAAAVVVVAGLAGGAVAIGTGGDADEGVVAGPVTEPVGRPDGAPPAEPADGAVTITLEAGPPADGLPTAEPGSTISATFDGDGHGFGRPAAAAWERWDGTTWVTEHVLQAELAGEPGSGAVLAVDEPITSGQLRFDEEVDRYPTPDALDAGWYRLCVPMHQYSGAGPTIPGDAPLEIPPAPLGNRPEPAPVQPAHFGATIWPCAQLRVPGGVASTTTAPEETVASSAPPPAEPDLPVSLDFGPELAPGGLVFGDFVWAEGASGTRGLAATWEVWDGAVWSPTHQTTVTGFDAVPEIAPIDEAPAVATLAVPAEARVAFLVPPASAAPPGTYRLCLDIQVEQPAPEGVTLCEQITMTEPDLVGGFPGRDAATWEVDPDDPPSPDD